MTYRPAALLALLVALGLAHAGPPAALDLSLRSRVAKVDGFAVVEKKAAWNPRQTAVIVCDMWDSHHCLNAVHREEELVPRMNQLLEKARAQGALIIHAPSSCMKPYENHVGRKLAKDAPAAKNLPKDIGIWCYKIPSEEKGTYPLDQTDGGCDTDPLLQAVWQQKLKDMGRNPGSPWLKQHDGLKIHDQDAISDSGVEIWNLLEARGINHVMILGVHTNMCVLGRPFGLRQLAKNGKNVVLVRDMTDTMYNPGRWPYVSHFKGTERIVEHIEKFVCPTITSDQVLGGAPFRFKDDVKRRVVLAIAEAEYDTKTTLPILFKQLAEEQNLDVTIIHGDKGKDDLPGLIPALEKAELLVVSIRRRALPEKELAAIKAYVESGKPLIGIRTASHAFHTNGKHPQGTAEWQSFDPDVLGGHYTGHHGANIKAAIEPAPGAEKHPLLEGVKLPLSSNGSLYKTSPLAKGTTPLLVGSIPGTTEPVAWINTAGKNRVFYTSLGYRDDFQEPGFVRLMGHAVRWTSTK